MEYTKHLTYKNLAILTVIIITIYGLVRCINVQSSLLEGLTNKVPNPLNSKLNEESTYNNLDDNIMDLSNRVRDHINYGQHKDKLDNLVTALHEYSHYQLLERYVDYANNISKNNTSGAAENLDHIHKLNSSIGAMMKSQNFIEQTS